LVASDDRWTLPIGGGIGKLFRLGKLSINTQPAAYSNVVKPRQGGADWAAPLPGTVSFPEMKTKKPFLNPFGRHRHAAC
jgi:hypothetical protein